MDTPIHSAGGSSGGLCALMVGTHIATQSLVCPQRQNERRCNMDCVDSSQDLFFTGRVDVWLRRIFVHHVATFQRPRCRFGFPPTTAWLASGPCFCLLEWQRMVAAAWALGLSCYDPASRPTTRWTSSTTPRPSSPVGCGRGPGFSRERLPGVHRRRSRSPAGRRGSYFALAVRPAWARLTAPRC